MDALQTQHAAVVASPAVRRLRGGGAGHAAPGRVEFGRPRRGGSARDVLGVAGLGRYSGQAAGAVNRGGSKNNREVVLNYYRMGFDQGAN